MAAEYDVYTEQLYTVKQGLALYEPDPAGQYDHVRVGDVGFVQYGYFHRMFNIFVDEEDPINRRGVPDHFSPLPSAWQSTFQRTPLTPGTICSTSVSKNGTSLEISADAVQAGASVNLSCRYRQGAALLLRYPALRCDSSCQGALGKYMLDHYKDWHAFAKQRHNPFMPLRDIILVTGCDLAREWATATFTDRASDASISFTVGVSPYASAEGSFWGSWSTNVSMPYRCGPVIRAIADGIAGLIVDSSTSIRSPVTSTNDQCMFIRAYRVHERPLFIPNVLKAAAGPPDQKFHRDADPGNTVLSHLEVDDNSLFEYEVELEVNDGSSETAVGNLHDLLFQHLFENSSADIALIHDDDIISIVSDNPYIESWSKHPLVFPPVNSHLRGAAVSTFSSTFDALNVGVDRAEPQELTPTTIEAIQPKTIPSAPTCGSNILDELESKDSISTPENTPENILSSPEAMKQILGPDHPEPLRMVAKIASLYSKHGRWAEVEGLEMEALESRKRVLGADHPDTLRRMESLITTYQKQGRLEEAENLVVEVLEARKRVLGPDHFDTLRSMASLASTYGNQDRLDEAETLGVEVLEAMKRVLGPDHLDTISTMAMLAATYRKVGRRNEAENLEVNVLKARKRILGPDHLDTISAMVDLASTYSNGSRWNESEKVITELLVAMKRALGLDHPDTISTMAKLATTYRMLGRRNEAENLDVDVLEARKRVLGDHLDAISIMVGLILVFASDPRWNETEKVVNELLETMKRVLGPDHPDTILTMAKVAATYRRVGLLNEANNLDVDVLEAKRRVLGPDHPYTLKHMASLARDYREQGCLHKAENLGVEVREARMRVLGEKHLETFSSMRDLAFVQYLLAIESENEAYTKRKPNRRERRAEAKVAYRYGKAGAKVVNQGDGGDIKYAKSLRTLVAREDE